MQATTLFSREDLEAMHQQPVMVNPVPRNENPPVGMRGTIHVDADGEVDVVLDFAAMFDRPAKHTSIRMTPPQIAMLRAARARNGDYSIMLDQPIPVPPVEDCAVDPPRT